MADLLTRLEAHREWLIKTPYFKGISPAELSEQLATVNDAIERERGARSMALKLYAMTDDAPLTSGERPK